MLMTNTKGVITMLNKKFNKYLQILAVLGLVLCSAPLLSAQKYREDPLPKPRLLKSVKTRDVAVDIIVLLIKQHGVNFKLTVQVEQEFASVKANRIIINAIRDNYRAPVVAAAATKAKKPDTKYSVISENPPQPENTNEKYEQLVAQGEQLAAQFNPNFSQQQLSSYTQSLKNHGNQQIKLNPARFEGYRTVAFSFVLTENYNEAERYGQMAIDRGGSLRFGVLHMVSGNVHTDLLHVAKGFISIENVDGKYNPFYNSEVTGFQVFPTLVNFEGTYVAGFSISTFKNNASLRYDFAPYRTTSIGEANLIKRLVQANINR